MDHSILVFGAGRSAWFTLDYLSKGANNNRWSLTVADASETPLTEWQGRPNVETIAIDILNAEKRRALVSGKDVVISLLPAQYHILVALNCLESGTHLVTPSYLNEELKELDQQVKKAGLIFLTEIGLDPGIDHMSAMKIIDMLRSEGASIRGFKSWCGGLVAPNSDDNPWHYKISWAPYNVIRAGQDGGLCKENGQLRFVPYHRLFAEAETIKASGEEFDGYLNRNSLRYPSLYGLEETNTFIRGTLRHRGFCSSWNALVQIGLTNDRIQMPIEAGTSFNEYVRMFLPGHQAWKSFLEGIDATPANQDYSALTWLLDSNEKLNSETATPAEILQTMLERRWKMNANDKDRVVMLHEFEYLKRNGTTEKLQSLLDIEGEDSHKTAMAKTVGLPLALASELIMEGRIKSTGILLPTLEEIYEPLLAKLSSSGIKFTESVAN